MSASPATPTGSDSQSFAALKRVKAVEIEWATKLAAARQESETALARLSDESAAAIKAVIAEGEQERAATIQTARTELAEAAATIAAQGAKAADAALRSEGKDPEAQKDKILAVVLGGFASD